MPVLAANLNAAVGPRSLATRDEVLERYRALRAISSSHHSELVQCVRRDDLFRVGRKLGLLHGKTFTLDDLEEMYFVYDLAIHCSPPGVARTIDRYAKSVSLEPDCDQASVLRAMVDARFALLRVERRHELAGLVMLDLTRDQEIWLVDEGMEQSLPIGGAIATRLYQTDPFAMTAGVLVPIDTDMLNEVAARTPFLERKSDDEIVRDRRFAETLYQVALEQGLADRVSFQDALSASA